jgi:membrane-associated protease RseP (regulator of RpoE activity)
MEFLPVDPLLRKELHVAKEVNGVVVGQVASDSAAGELGIQPDDVVVSVDKSQVTTPESAAAQLKEGAEQRNVLLWSTVMGRANPLACRSKITAPRAAATEPGYDHLSGGVAARIRTSSSGRNSTPTSSKTRWRAPRVAASGAHSQRGTPCSAAPASCFRHPIGVRR